MAIHNLPPQAYTRDVLVKAIDWVATQSTAVRERASSADALVSLFLQARRRTTEWHDAPVSSENFKTDLKHLAQDLKQFDEPSAPPPVSQTQFHHHEPVPFSVEPPSIRAVPNPPPPPKATTWAIDSRSLAAARELQHRMNLGSEQEALRFLVTMGIERARQMFP